MTIYYMPQHGEEWFQARAGKLTASELHKCITPLGKVSDSETATGYVESVVWEMLAGKPGPSVPQTAAMRWGTENEQYARDVYERFIDMPVDQAGLVTDDDEPLLAFSPDGLVGDDGGIQIKCPYTPGPHFAVVRSIARGEPTIPKQYVVQVYCELAFSRRQWWDYVSYDPRLGDLRLAFCVVRAERNELTDKIYEAARTVRDRVMESFLELDSLRRKR